MFKLGAYTKLQFHINNSVLLYPHDKANWLSVITVFRPHTHSVVLNDNASVENVKLNLTYHHLQTDIAKISTAYRERKCAKIIIHDPINIYFLNCNNPFANFEP